LRRHFEVDAESICIAALYPLCQEGRIAPAGVASAIRMLGVDPEKLDPLHPNLTGRKAAPVEVEV
jgi:pyruvate dehydrogenase E1 component